MKKNEKHKNTQKKPDNSKLYKLIGILFVSLAVLFVLRGWVRETILPKTIHTIYGSSVSKVYKNEMSKLQNPASLLGYTNSATKDTCFRVKAKGLKTLISCESSSNNFREITSQDTGILLTNATNLQADLKTNGWQGEFTNEGVPYTSLVKLVNSLTSGIDYQPDATYTKKVGDVTCSIGTNTAYSKPNPPAMSTQITCYRTFNVLGEPSWD